MSLWTNVKGTKVFSYREEKKDEIITEVAGIFRSGGVVALPTETVYGLGAVVLHRHAVNRIFTVKGRPLDNPMIVHLGDVSQVDSLVEYLPPELHILAEHFWPGPLSLILRRKKEITSLVSGGLSTIALRIPHHFIALHLLRELAMPVAAPSANISGKPSPTEAAHVIEDFAGKIDAILDGGKCPIGVESTVLDLTGDAPVLLRPGSISREELENCLKRPVIVPERQSNLNKAKSPGMKYRHYAPEAHLILFKGDPVVVEKNMKYYYGKYLKEGKKIGILCTWEKKEAFPKASLELLGRQGDLKEAAVSLYGALRNLDGRGVDIILAEGFREEGLGAALMNRLEKAADDVIEN